MPNAPLPEIIPTTVGGEYALACGQGGTARLLVLPALFDEANKLRHFTAAVMRHLAASGVDCLLPDLPGTNESLAPLDTQSLSHWRAWAQQAAYDWGASRVLAMRGSAILLPPALPAIAYAPVDGPAMLRAMLRSSVIREKEAGRVVTRDALLEEGVCQGLVLNGHALGPAMIGELSEAALPADLARIAQDAVGGSGLWLRAEPDHNAAQAAQLAALVLGHCT